MPQLPQEDPHVEVTPSRVQNELVTLPEPILGCRVAEFTGHALLQMKDRAISKEDVLRAIRTPSRDGLDTQDGRQRVRWNKTRGLAIDVVFDILPDRLRIITAFPRKRPLRDK